MTTIEKIYNHYRTNYQLTTDSRAVEAGMVYLALKGERFDGNQFANHALSAGASLVIIDNEEFYEEDERIVLVKDCLITLQLLARHHREVLNVPVIALTGTNGKTTTKELLYVGLSTKYNVQATGGNFNNHIGVPLTILQSTPLHNLLIIEMGANHIGEIRDLCNIALPDIGLITNIGKAHLEGFGGYEGVIKAKSEMYQYLKNTGGTIVFNDDDNLLSELVQDYHPSIAYGIHSEYKLNSAYPKLTFDFNNQSYSSQLVGQYNLGNIATAIAVGRLMNCGSKEMIEAICNYSPTNNRSQSINKNGIYFVLDAYNANPSSMELAIKGFGESAFDSKLLILGDMLELGSGSPTEHRKTINQCKGLENIEVIFVGPLFKKFEQDNPEFRFFTTVEELTPIMMNLDKGTNCFVKGSRGIQLEKILDALN